jgi:Fe-S cluster assembly ATP-binding protein
MMGNEMIYRIWHGYTTPENGDAYEALLKSEIFGGIELKGIRGFKGIDLLRRRLGDEEEFITVMRFDTLDAVRAFVGEDYETSYVPDAARKGKPQLLDQSGPRLPIPRKLELYMLEIKNLRVKVADEDAEILRGIDLKINPGEVHAIMGPNGSGKSTLSYVLAGKDDYEITAGEVLYNGENLLDMAPDERAAAGLFLAFQYPIEIPGVGTMTFLKTAMNAQRKARGEEELTTPDFMRRMKEVAQKLKILPDMLKRPLNVGFSGGEKKRNEILQMALLEPTLCVMDETDSGLDIDALRIVADGVNTLRAPDRSFLVITHYQRLLNHIVPDVVHVLSKGRIVKTGGKELALELEERGYADFVEEAA